MKKDVGVLEVVEGSQLVVTGKDLTLDCYTKKTIEAKESEEKDFPRIAEIGPTGVYIWQVMTHANTNTKISIWLKVPSQFFAVQFNHVRVMLCRELEEDEIRIEEADKWMKAEFNVSNLFDTLYQFKIRVLVYDEAMRIQVGKIEITEVKTEEK
jgi:hypothetical protein